jgi:predicted O-methyltransferase YrrM
MRIVDIRQKLEEIQHPVSQFVLGDFDFIGEYTARKNRNPQSELYRTAGCFFRPNYERGLLIYALIKKFNITSVLEIGTGRGYASVCAAKALFDSGISGRVVSVDPALSAETRKVISQFPSQWTSMIEFRAGTSATVVPTLPGTFDLVYIDGDHSYEGTKLDWEMTKDRYDKFLLFDDYHMPSHGGDGGIQCARLIDEIDDQSKELILMDRRIFHDDRGVKDLDYGQVLLTNHNFDAKAALGDW